MRHVLPFNSETFSHNHSGFAWETLNCACLTSRLDPFNRPVEKAKLLVAGRLAGTCCMFDLVVGGYGWFCKSRV